MAAKWEPGAKAVIVVSEWPKTNLGRVVTLMCGWTGEVLEGVPQRFWTVEDGNLFEGTGMEGYANAGEYVQSETLLIAQWKLRLLEPDEFTEDINGIVYTVEHADA